MYIDGAPPPAPDPARPRHTLSLRSRLAPHHTTIDKYHIFIYREPFIHLYNTLYKIKHQYLKNSLLSTRIHCSLFPHFYLNLSAFSFDLENQYEIVYSLLSVSKRYSEKVTFRKFIL